MSIGSDISVGFIKTSSSPVGRNILRFTISKRKNENNVFHRFGSQPTVIDM